MVSSQSLIAIAICMYVCTTYVVLSFFGSTVKWCKCTYNYIVLTRRHYIGIWYVTLSNEYLPKSFKSSGVMSARSSTHVTPNSSIFARKLPSRYSSSTWNIYITILSFLQYTQESYKWESGLHAILLSHMEGIIILYGQSFSSFFPLGSAKISFCIFCLLPVNV